MTAVDAPSTRLRITEIFQSLQGESRTVGLPTVFVRLTGCPLRCDYCDSEYAFTGGQWMTLDEVLSEVARYPARHVTVTGGEPLAQRGCLDLLRHLLDQGRLVSLETSGALDISAVDARAVKVLDIKTPDSGEVERNRWENLAWLSPLDQIKFVLCSRADYEWARDCIHTRDLTTVAEVLLSPCYGRLSPTELAEWILQDGLQVRFQLQLHKVLWGDEPGR